VDEKILLNMESGITYGCSTWRKEINANMVAEKRMGNTDISHKRITVGEEAQLGLRLPKVASSVPHTALKCTQPPTTNVSRMSVHFRYSFQLKDK
jgi:hypothetical protein